jgi:hypothetical protein
MKELNLRERREKLQRWNKLENKNKNDLKNLQKFK